mgnify:CR=1 FL=1
MLNLLPMSVSRRQLLQQSAWASAATALGLLAACGGPSPQATVPSSSAAPAKASAAVSTSALTSTAASGSDSVAAPAAQGSATLASAGLDVWIWWNDPLEVTTQIAKNFSAQNPQATAKVEVPPDYWTKVQATLAGGVGPDMYLMNNVNYWSFSNLRLLVDLAPLMAGDSDAQDFLKNAWQPGVQFYQYKGKTAGLPFMFNAVVVIYNEAAIKEAGLQPPAELGTDWTWDTLQSYAEKLTKRNGDATSVWGAYASDGIENGWLSVVRANGGDFLSGDAKTCIIDQPPSVAAWQFLTDLLLKYRVSPTADVLSKTSPVKLIGSGQLVLYDTTTGGLRMIKEGSPAMWPNLNYAVVPFSPTTHRSGGNTNIIGWVLNKAGKHTDPSWALLKYMLTKPSQDLVAKANIDMPARVDSAQIFYDPAQMGGPPNRKALQDMAQWTTPLPTAEIVTWTDMMAPTTKWANQILMGKVPVADGLKQMASQVNGLFAAGKP